MLIHQWVVVIILKNDGRDNYKYIVLDLYIDMFIEIYFRYYLVVLFVILTFAKNNNCFTY